MTNWDETTTLRNDVSVEMFEACIARIFGKTALTSILAKLHMLACYYDGLDIDEMHRTLISQRKLLGQVAEKSAWGESAIEDHDELALMVYCVIGPARIDEFVAQAQRRIVYSR